MRWPPVQSPIKMCIRRAFDVLHRIVPVARCAVPPVGRARPINPKAERLLRFEKMLIRVSLHAVRHIVIRILLVCVRLILSRMIHTMAEVGREPIATVAVMEHVNPVGITGFPVRVSVGIEFVFHNAAQVPIAILAKRADPSLVETAIAHR